ncbi:efflux RND transporter periplasmic adaptor subunit [Lamprobacter modestohalophilus]|uniref:efflux RND transporter periplasmic adaptor subunit n=1 Tax=Lamprobacter modestohalophilus TaxID=1064514 RepID=UPI002ADEC43E|nr:efflux RND transporter periplasmic adaptor subunit [Lamprobacter modestohalophilus]MEA1052936.1 efflux RND transporter periplasmic adaptor subunit [Lamprobacter modestohalophilus]
MSRATLGLLGLLLVTGSSWAQPQSPGVILSEARVAEVADRVEALGTLRANESVTITATVTETISVIRFEDGQQVAAGDVLVEMTSREQHARLEEAQARLAEAEQQYQRVKSLEATGSASASLLDERRRDLRAARATLAAIESQLADRLIKAPFAGVVGLRNISLGALVEPGDVITTLDDDRSMKLDFPVPSLFLPSLKPGLAIEARSPALGNRRFEGEVSSVASRIDPVTRTIQVRARIDNPERTLRPGLLMQVELLRDPREAVMVPEAAILQRGAEHAVLVVEEGADGEMTAERRPVEVGLRRPGEVEILAGLKLGERVITHGADKARPGQPVQVMAIDDGSRPLAELLAQPASNSGDTLERIP